MLDTITMLLNAKTSDRNLVRLCLKTLYFISGYIDRQLFMFEHHKLNSITGLPAKSKAVARELREELMKHIGGWMVPNELPWSKSYDLDGPVLYLELPYRRAHNLTNSNLMAEALYREQDPEFVLLLLRHGFPPACLYLWPICVLIDFRISYQPGGLKIDRFPDDKESQMIRYFCRARHFINVQIANSPADREMVEVSDETSLDQLLWTPPSVLSIIPEDRHLHPSSLMHQSRLAIRKTLQENDNLPGGVSSLPFPKFLKRYVDLLED